MIESIVRRTLSRFTLAAASVFGILSGLIAVAEPRGLTTASLAGIAVELAMVTCGFLFSAIAFRSRQRDRGSARSYVFAGLIAPFGLAALSPFAQGTNLTGIIVLSGGTGAIIGLLHRLVTSKLPRPPKPTLEELERAADEELARLEALGSLPVGVIPIKQPDKQRTKPIDQVA